MFMADGALLESLAPKEELWTPIFLDCKNQLQLSMVILDPYELVYSKQLYYNVY